MKVLVIGDSILDKYVFGKVERINPEAPSLILDYEKEEEILGGACNVAANIRSLSQDKDLKIDYFGFASSKLIKLLDVFFISFIGVACDQNDILTKNRFISQNQYLLRLDINKKYKEELVLIAQKLIQGINFNDYDIIVVSDYDKNTFNEIIAEKLFSYDGPILIDLKKYRHWILDYNLMNTIIKCNEKEFYEGKVENIKFSKVNSLVVTLGRYGYSIIKPLDINGNEDIKQYSAIKLNGSIFDVVGAGDTFLAGMAVSFLESNKFDCEKMCKFGNKAAAHKVQQFGTKAVNRWKIKDD